MTACPAIRQQLRPTPVRDEARPLRRSRRGVARIAAAGLWFTVAVTGLHANPAALPAKEEQSAQAFTLSTQTLQEIRAALPDLGSPTGQTLVHMMQSVYVGAPDAGVMPDPDPSLLRVASWNVAGCDQTSRLTGMLAGDTASLAQSSDKANAQLGTLAAADTFMLQELSLPVAVQIARKLHYGLIWGPEFIELGTTSRKELPGRGQEVSGNAILSRYPLAHPRIIRFDIQAEWYEKDPGLDTASGAALARMLDHPIRPPWPYGGRMALIVDADIPYSSGEWSGRQMTFIDMQLESKARPELRRQQMEEVLKFIKATKGPVIFGGDLNTSGEDGLGHRVDPLTKGLRGTKASMAMDGLQTVGSFVPYGGDAFEAFDVLSWLKTHKDPTSHLSGDRPLMQDVRAADTDPSSDDLRSSLETSPSGPKPSGPPGQRGLIGYKSTVPRKGLFDGSGYVLDWLFLHDGGPDRYYVTDARTLDLPVKKSAKKSKDWVSNHFPVLIDVPLLPSSPNLTGSK